MSYNKFMSPPVWAPPEDHRASFAWSIISVDKCHVLGDTGSESRVRLMLSEFRLAYCTSFV